MSSGTTLADTAHVPSDLWSRQRTPQRLQNIAYESRFLSLSTSVRTATFCPCIIPISKIRRAIRVAVLQSLSVRIRSHSRLSAAERPVVHRVSVTPSAAATIDAKSTGAVTSATYALRLVFALFLCFFNAKVSSCFDACSADCTSRIAWSSWCSTRTADGKLVRPILIILAGMPRCDAIEL